MLTKRIIASLLLKNGRLVKGRQCKDHRDAGNPVTTIRALCNQGADEIILLDIAEDAPHWDVLESVADVCTVPLTFGGGLQSTDDIKRAFRGGADKVFLPIHKRALIEATVLRCGRQSVVVGVDVQPGQPLPCQEGCEHRVLSIDAEGRRTGMDETVVARWQPNTPLILEGGAGNLSHIAEAFRAGADAVALGTMLTFGDNNILKIKRHLKQQGFAVRV